MIKRISILIVALSAVSIASFLYYVSITENEESEEVCEANVFAIKTFESNEGWGYLISKNGDVIIYQPYIPCVRGEKSFPDEKSASQIGELVLSKVKNNENPSVTIEELSKIINLKN